MIKIEKSPIFYTNKVMNSTPEIFSLLEKYAHHKEKS